MLFDPRSFVSQVAELHTLSVSRWSSQPLDNPCTGLMAVVCQQHQLNYQLWREQDVSRRPGLSDHRLADAKRAIDHLNQQRSDWIERIDETLVQMLTTGGVIATAGAQLNTETPGSAIDRLSILALRVYYLRKELDQTEQGGASAVEIKDRLRRCGLQHADLSQSLSELLSDIFAGRKLMKVFRHMKTYAMESAGVEQLRRAG